MKTNLKINPIKLEPTGIFRSGHTQTIYPALFVNPPNIKNTKEIYIDIEEEVKILCEYNTSQKKAAIVLVHGLEGSSRSNYVISLSEKLLKKGFDTIRVNLRGCGNTLHLSKTLYNAGLSQDILKVVKYFKDNYQYESFFVVGFSLGANTVLKLSGEIEDNHSEIKGICAVSPPLDLAESSREIIKRKNYIYDNHYLQRMKKTYEQKAYFFPEHFNIKTLKPVSNLFDFDHYVTAPCFGYQSADHYYEENSSLQFIPKIVCPTLIIQAKDDPIIPFNSTIRAMNYNNPQVHYLTPDFGGHVGFRNSISKGLEDYDILWAENRVYDFITSLS